MLEGSEKDNREVAEKRSLDEDQEEEPREEIEEQIKKMKRKKAADADGIGSEVWMYSEGQIRGKLKELCKLIWRGKEFPEEWREGLIAPIYKKEATGDVRSYAVVHSI